MTDEMPNIPEETPEAVETSGVSRRKFLGGVAGASIGGLTLAGVLAACGGGGDEEPEAATTTAAGQDAANSAKPILIGSAYPMTTADGEEMKGGSDLAIAEINERGGIGGRMIEHEIVDFNNFDGESATSAYNNLVSKEADAITLGYANVYEPNDILAAYGAPSINASTSSDQVNMFKSDPAKYKNIFQADPTDLQYGYGFPPFLEGLIAQGLFNPPTKTIYIFEGDIPYSSNISKAAQEVAPDLGWEIVGISPIAGTGGPVTDWAPMISKAKGSGATVVFNTHWNPADHAALMKQWAADPPDAFLYLQYGASVPEFLEIAGDSANGVVWATVLGTMNDAVGLAYQERYKAKWGKVAGFSNAGTGYDEVYMLAHAWGITGDTRNFDANIAELKRNIMRGVSGGYWFGHDEANYCLAYPQETPDPSLGNPHLFFQISPGEDGALSHQVIAPSPYIQTAYVKPPWLSF